MRCAANALLFILLLPQLGGCTAPRTSTDIPAVIIEPNTASRVELQAVVQTALNGAPVMLAPDALTESSILTIEQSAPRGLDAPPATGRMLGRPEVFLLVLDGPQCTLIQQASGMRWLLIDSQCRPE